ncbi:hypothetical protein DY000_02056849 [Brassica cretica]|uniref:C-JID domain-containing protein n=1 Tax=Brassica cretica TaxID=69181 RepID=A0ABQ7AJ56_BRACR|nr:hypothetical protein DY000_02056849 [Brassica cretica]
MLPVNEIPDYFNYQANGGSLVMKLNDRPFPSSMIWKACILLVRKDEVEAGIGQWVDVHHGIKQNSLDVPCNPSYHILYRPLTEHLYIFEFEADVTSDELCFEFRVNREEWMIKECGVHYLYPMNKRGTNCLIHLDTGSGGVYTVSLFEDLARSHGVKIAPHVETIMPGIVRTLSSCGGALSVQLACSKAVAAIARYGIDPATAEDKKKNLIHSLSGVRSGDAQKRVLAVQMLNFLMKYVNPKSMSSEVELVLQEMGKHVEDEVYFVRVAVHETLGTAERLIREADGENCKIQFSGGEGDNMESVCFHQRSISSEFDDSVCSVSNHSRRSRRNKKKRRSERSRHGFRQDSFSVLLENREQLRQYSESSSSSSIHDRSGTTTPTEDICEKPKSEAKVKTEARIVC